MTHQILQRSSEKSYGINAGLWTPPTQIMQSSLLYSSSTESLFFCLKLLIFYNAYYLYPDFRIIKWTATEISKSRSCHGREAKGRKGRKETHLWKKVTLAALSILLWVCISKKLVKMKQMSSETTASLCEAIFSENCCILNSFIFL